MTKVAPFSFSHEVVPGHQLGKVCWESHMPEIDIEQSVPIFNFPGSIFVEKG